MLHRVIAGTAISMDGEELWGLREGQRLSQHAARFCHVGSKRFTKPWTSTWVEATFGVDCGRSYMAMLLGSWISIDILALLHKTDLGAWTDPAWE